MSHRPDLTMTTITFSFSCFWRLCCNSRPVVNVCEYHNKPAVCHLCARCLTFAETTNFMLWVCLFLSLFYYDTAYLWHVICQSTEIHYSEVLTVPQVNRTLKLCKNELNICKLCASNMCVTIFVHRNVWAQLFWLFHRSSCVHQCPS